MALPTDMEQLALFALPRHDDNELEDDSAASSDGHSGLSTRYENLRERMLSAKMVFTNLEQRWQLAHTEALSFTPDILNSITSLITSGRGLILEFEEEEENRPANVLQMRTAYDNFMHVISSI